MLSAVVGATAILSGCADPAGGAGVTADAAMPPYLDQFVADDGLFMVPQLRRQARADGATSASFAGDMRATYLFVMLETLIGRPFVDSRIADAVAKYPLDTDPMIQPWEAAFRSRIDERLRGRLAAAETPNLRWMPDLAGPAGRYILDMAVLCVDLGLSPANFPGSLKTSAVTETVISAAALVGTWAVTEDRPPVRADRASWQGVVEAGLAGRIGSRELLTAATALVISGPRESNESMVDAVATYCERVRGVDGVPWLVPSDPDKASEGGDILASLAGVMFDVAATGSSFTELIRGRGNFTTALGVHL